MISHSFFCPAQVSWSNVLVLFSFIFFCLAQVSQCDDFQFLIFYVLASFQMIIKTLIYDPLNNCQLNANSECTLWNDCHRCFVWH